MDGVLEEKSTLLSSFIHETVLPLLKANPFDASATAKAFGLVPNSDSPALLSPLSIHPCTPLRYLLGAIYNHAVYQSAFPTFDAVLLSFQCASPRLLDELQRDVFILSKKLSKVRQPVDCPRQQMFSCVFSDAALPRSLATVRIAACLHPSTCPAHTFLSPMEVSGH